MVIRGNAAVERCCRKTPRLAHGNGFPCFGLPATRRSQGIAISTRPSRRGGLASPLYIQPSLVVGKGIARFGSTPVYRVPMIRMQPRGWQGLGSLPLKSVRGANHAGFPLLLMEAPM